MSVAELQKYTAVSKYARWLEDKGRREVWGETVGRYADMMAAKYPGRAARVRDLCDRYVVPMRVLPSMRALQFGGPPALKVNARIYNCLALETEFITREGVKSFADFKDGDETVVLTHKGNWKRARVRCYGQAALYKATFRRRGSPEFVVWATANHRWLVRGDAIKSTQELREGEYLVPPPTVFDFDYDSAPPDERMLWAYGYVYGDGTRVKNKVGEYRYSMVRLCGGDKAKFKHRFEELGFAVSEPKSCGGDAVAYTGHYLKQPIDPTLEEHRLVVAFVRGYMDADAGKHKGGGTRSEFTSIQATGEEECEFIRQVFPAAGMYLTSERDLTGQTTNYGVRPYTRNFRILSGFSDSTAYRLVSYELEQCPRFEDVWCLEVEDDQSFVLPNGLVTGNCTSSYVDRLSFFGHAFYLLLCGCGVGYSVQARHLESLPNFSAARRAGRKLPVKRFVIPDSIDGWAECAHVQLTSYHGRPVPGYEEWLDCEVEFDYSLIREKGTPLSFGVGTAPGPDPLRRAMERNAALLDRAVASGLTRFDSVTASDYHLNNSDAVISGGLRRSANIGIFDLHDGAMVAYKTGDWRAANPQRGRANMSAMLVRWEVAEADFRRLFAATKEFGEPGFWWADHPDIMPNPCAEIGKYDRLLIGKSDPLLPSLLAAYDGPVVPVGDRVGLTGFQFCNLTLQNGRLVRTADDFVEAAEVAAELGTYQAGFTSFPFVGRISELITEREALLGVSIAGVMHNPAVMLDPATLERAAAVVRRRNDEVAAAVGINPAARLTCIKPDGNAGSTLGCFSGCHPGKIRRGFRISQANRAEAPYKHFKSVNPAACEPSCWSANGTDDVVRFCVEYDGLLEDDMTAVQFLEAVRVLQKHWVTPGTVPERCTIPGLAHNVSNTVKVRNDAEWDAVAAHIYEHRADYGGVSFISAYGDRDYPQAPFTPVFLPDELEAAYGAAGVAAAGSLVDELPAGPSYVLWDWCDAARGLREPTAAASRWVGRLKAVAIHSFGGDLAKAVYAVKDAYNLRLWERLRAAYRPVDYAEMAEERSGVDFAGEVACAGGACER